MTHHHEHRARWAVAALGLIAASSSEPPAPAGSADAIYFGGAIVTANDAQPGAEAIAVKDGRIVAVGSRAEVEKSHRGAASRMVDLAGRTLVPGFIDPHSHFIDSLTMADRANVAPPPVGPARDADEVVATLQAFAKTRAIKPGELIVGSGYDDNLMPDGRLVSRDCWARRFPTTPL